MKVWRGDPVVAIVALDHSITAVGLHELLARGAHPEVTATHDNVSVARCFSGGDNRIHSALGEPRVSEPENRKSARVFSSGQGGHAQGPQGGSGRSELHGRVGNVISNTFLWYAILRVVVVVYAQKRFVVRVLAKDDS